MTGVAIKQRWRQLRRGEVQGAAAAHHEQIFVAVVIKVAPGDARSHILRQLRRARAVELTERRQSGRFRNVRESRLRRTGRKLAAGVAQRVSHP